MIVAGWDPEEGGSVYALPLGGSLIKVPFSIGASIAHVPFLCTTAMRQSFELCLAESLTAVHPLPLPEVLWDNDLFSCSSSIALKLLRSLILLQSGKHCIERENGGNLSLNPEP